MGGSFRTSGLLLREKSFGSGQRWGNVRNGAVKQQQIERPPEATNLAAGGQGELPKDFGLEAGFSSGQLLNAARLREAAVENVGRAASFAMIEIMKSSMPACRPIWKWVVRHVSRPLVFALLLLAPAVGLSAAEFQIE